MGLIMEVCAMARIVDPGDFFALPAHVRALWLGHAYNKVSGQYIAKRQATTGDLTVTPEAQALLDGLD